jgi:hypothetical protein
MKLITSVSASLQQGLLSGVYLATRLLILWGVLSFVTWAADIQTPWMKWALAAVLIWDVMADSVARRVVEKMGEAHRG